MLRCDIITIFPEFFREAFDYGIIRRARAAGLVETKAHDLRRWTSDKHHVVDDRPFGGGEGMVLKPEPIFAAVRSLGDGDKRCILLSPAGRRLDQAFAREISKEPWIVLICGRYEGVDERVVEGLPAEEISIGDYVLSGGELPALVLLEAASRLVPGVVGSEASLEAESFESGLLDHPHYTRPRVFEGYAVPEVLVSGDHQAIERWRRDAAREKTRRNRPDLLDR